MEKSLEENRLKDSFDKLIENTSRNLKITKKTLRVSFNMDSSVENSRYDTGILEENYKNCLKKKCNWECSSPTSYNSSSAAELFDCPLSPIESSMILDPIICTNGNREDAERKKKMQKTECFGILTPDMAYRKGRRLITQGRKSFFLKTLIKNDRFFEQDVLRYCDQFKPYPFNTAYAQYKMLNAVKIGEGTYGEVFRYTSKKNAEDVILKIIPIEGHIEINGEKQKTFSEIMPEIIITKIMSGLQGTNTNCTNGFTSMHKILAATAFAQSNRPSSRPFVFCFRIYGMFSRAHSSCGIQPYVVRKGIHYEKNLMLFGQLHRPNGIDMLAFTKMHSTYIMY
ncbi:serine/threonine-protein kinase haspin homolog [Drosophila eugracilis]|uniref:serine/threonine-protein kinase haspin homolog n=1 Tax=Drosophila eugracilis TaxID=29029 RepID=UPI001BDB6BBC|nr:serine/threonine-protein kinase haspin homolog [Drosophila eugracilis]